MWFWTKVKELSDDGEAGGARQKSSSPVKVENMEKEKQENGG